MDVAQLDPKLLELICAFEVETAEALRQFLERADLSHPFNWQQAGLPRKGKLPGQPEIRYAFHGIGLDLRIGKQHLDFDLGFDGRTGGFNHWWLWLFATTHPDRFPEFQDAARLEAALKEARQIGAVGQPFLRQQDKLEYLLIHSKPDTV